MKNKARILDRFFTISNLENVFDERAAIYELKSSSQTFVIEEEEDIIDMHPEFDKFYDLYT
ncbi:MAG: hypothetical protein GY760_13975 [Deltaproteobacteria bacterium]|nr:hypothetical protein [Deltaproteobacteria bacterium]